MKKNKQDINKKNMVGHKLGEFSPTRTFRGHTPADKKAKQEEEAQRSRKT